MMKNKTKNIQIQNNVWGSPREENKDKTTDQDSGHFKYKLYLFFLSETGEKHYLLKMAVDSDISEARLIASHMFRQEVEWLKIQEDLPPHEWVGVVLILHANAEHEEDLLVESSFEQHASLTEMKREKESAIFERLGKDYPERNFADL